MGGGAGLGRMPELSLDSIAAMFFQTSNSMRDDFTENMQLLPGSYGTGRHLQD
jgi:hypothetical protein